MSERLETPERARARLGEARMTERERAELWARIEHSAQRGRRGAVHRFWPLAVAGAAVAFFFVSRETTAPVAAPRAADPCALDADASTLRLPEHCGPRTVQIAGDAWQLEQGAEVARIEAGARVERGRVRFEVRPRKAPGARPFVVDVSHAEVHVIGTVFVIDQQQDRGSVHVTEGVVEVVFRDGATERVVAGESARWPRPGVEEAPEEAPQPAPQARDAGTRSGARAAKAVDMEAVLDRLLVLRSQKRFDEAVALLRDTLGQKGLGQTQRERISYELGLALEASGAQSCAHWQKHGASFSSERSAKLVAKKLEACAP